MDKQVKNIYIPLENVDSEHCAMIVDKGLAEVPAVDTHKVELNNNRAVITASDPQTAIRAVVQKIRHLGYEVTTLKKSFPVTGLSCASCASSSQDVLKMQPGVVSASVNYANGQAGIEFIPTITDPATLRSSLQSVGYDLLVEDDEANPDSLESIRQENYKALQKRTFWAIGLSIPLVIIGMTPSLMHQQWAAYAMWALATPVVAYFGKQFFVGAYKQTKHRSANMDTLVAVSTGIAYLFSVFNTLFPQVWTNRGLEAHLYFEASAVVIAFVLLGKMLEEKAKGSTSSAIKGLIGLQPKAVTVVHEGGYHTEIEMSSLKVGDIVLVKPGEKIAIDGEVISGNSYVDESMISGEPVAVEKKSGSMVFAGTLNQKGSFQFRAEKVGSETLLSQIIKTVQDAQGSKAPVQWLVDKIAGIFVPVVLAISVLTLIAWVILGGENGFTHGLMAMITVLVIACPCALGLATPTAIMVGVGKGAQHGILIKDAQSLETARKTDVIVLDKTGTLTVGKPQVTYVQWFKDESQDIKNILYTIESSSEHPLAGAIVNHLKNSSQFLGEILVDNVEGRGMEATYDNKRYFVGNFAMIAKNSINISLTGKKWLESRQNEAASVVFFADENELILAIAITDAIKETSSEAIRSLIDENIEVWMLTGDNEQTASAVAKQVGITNYSAEVLPQDKLEFVKSLQAKVKTVAMAGDGINDSAALAQADVGIAMGTGNDIAIDTAQITIVSGDLLKVPQAIKLSKQTVATIRQNLFWAFIYNLIGIPVAAGILYPVNGFLLSPMIAGAAMALSSVSVVSNSLLLKLKKL